MLMSECEMRLRTTWGVILHCTCQLDWASWPVNSRYVLASKVLGSQAHSTPWYMVRYSVLWQWGKRSRPHFFVFIFIDEETEVALLEPLHYTKELYTKEL